MTTTPATFAPSNAHPLTPGTVVQSARGSLIARVAARYSVEPAKMLDTLKATAFKVSGGVSVTNEQMMALLIVADQYGLNPFTKELFAFPDKGGIVPVVSVDGWMRIINQHPAFDGVDFAFDDAEMTMTCTIYRKDRQHPTVITEYMAECKRSTQPWQSHPRRMLRHKALIQCARVAFGFAGIYDDDEAARIIAADTPQPEAPPQPKAAPQAKGAAARLKAAVPAVAPPHAPLASEVIDEDGVIDMAVAGAQTSLPLPVAPDPEFVAALNGDAPPADGMIP